MLVQRQKEKRKTKGWVQNMSPRVTYHPLIEKKRHKRGRQEVHLFELFLHHIILVTRQRGGLDTPRGNKKEKLNHRAIKGK